MAETWISGNTGSATFGASSPGASATNALSFNTWSATFSRTVHDVTSFGDTGRRRILGIGDIQGSAGGFLSNDAAATAPGVFQGQHGTEDCEAAICLFLHTGASDDASYVFNGVINDIAVTTTMGGDATGTFNFQLSSGSLFQGTKASPGSTVIESWDES
jgi:hypothetical protein